MRALIHAAELALKEQRASAPATLCFVAAFAAMLTPLLLILGLKTGMIDEMTRRLIENPAHREVLPVGSGRYDQRFFETVGRFEETAFLVPNTRSIAARFTWVRNPDGGAVERGLALLPTGERDPLLNDAVPAPAGDQIVLTAEAARRLAADVGDRLEAVVVRRASTGDEAAAGTFEVVAIADAKATGKVAALVPLETLFAVEAYLDDPSIPPDGWLPADYGERFSTTASFRLYARSIHEVARLRDRLEGLGAVVRMRSDEVALILGLDRALDQVYLVLATCGGLGFWLGLTSNLRANVERLRPALSMLALLGAPGTLRFTVPVVQSVTIALAGLAVSFAGYRIGASAFAHLLRPTIRGEGLTRLGPEEVLAVLGVVLAGAVLAGIWAGVAAARVAPEEVLRWT